MVVFEVRNGYMVFGHDGLRQDHLILLGWLHKVGLLWCNLHKR